MTASGRRAQLQMALRRVDLPRHGRNAAGTTLLPTSLLGTGPPILRNQTLHDAPLKPRLCRPKLLAPI